jgi:hypothetical protein
MRQRPGLNAGWISREESTFSFYTFNGGVADFCVGNSLTREIVKPQSGWEQIRASARMLLRRGPNRSGKV